MVQAPNDDSALLHERGLRATPGRLALLKLMRSSASPVSLDEAVRQCGRGAGDRATVYRNLLALTKAGIVEEVKSSGKRQLYELALRGQDHQPHAHAHAVCTACGVVACVEQSQLPTLGAAPGWSISTQEFTLWGECPDCQDGKRPSSRKGRAKPAPRATPSR